MTDSRGGLRRVSPLCFHFSIKILGMNMKKYHLLLLLVFPLFLTSCFKDELPNTECDVLDVWIDGDQYKECFYQPETDMRFNKISSTENHIVFTVRSMLSLPEMPISFNLTPGATIQPANGSLQNFKEHPVVYTVTSEDGAWHREYIVEFREPDLPKLHYDFEDVELKKEKVSFLLFDVDVSYYSWFEMDDNGGRQDIWSTGNPGFGMGNSNANEKDYPTIPEENGYEGKCVKLVTRDAGPFGKPMNKPIAAGNLFLGKFDVDKVMTNALATTRMGIRAPFTEEPIKVTGFYKYKPGAEYINEKSEVVPGKVDEGHIYSVVYRNKDENGDPVMLDGSDVLSSKYVVKKAEMSKLPPTDEWTPFEMFFEGEELDEQLLDSRGYNFALVFSSSKDGAKFLGAIGSTLYIDKVTVVMEKDD